MICAIEGELGLPRARTNFLKDHHQMVGTKYFQELGYVGCLRGKLLIMRQGASIRGGVYELEYGVLEYGTYDDGTHAVQLDCC